MRKGGDPWLDSQAERRVLWGDNNRGSQGQIVSRPTGVR